MRKMTWTSVLCVISLAGLGIAAVFVYSQLSRKAADASWHKHAVKLRAAGEPITLKEIEQLRPVISPEQNGALIITRLKKELEALEFGEAEGIYYMDKTLTIPDFHSSEHDATLEKSRAFLASHSDLLNSLHELEKSEGGRLSVSYDVGEANPFSMMLPSLKPWRLAGRLLQLETLIAVRDNDIERAVKAIKMQAKLAETIQSEPTLICRLVQLSLDIEIIKSIEILSQLSELDETNARKLEEVIEARLKQRSLKTSIQAERATFVGICDGLAAGRFSWSDIMMTNGEFLPMSYTQIRTNQVNGIEFYNELVQAADDPMSIIRATQDVERRMRAMAGSMFKRHGSHQIIFTLMPSFSRVVEIHASCIARLRCTQIALAASRFRRDKGRLPDSPEDLVPDYLKSAPLDPFTNKQLKIVQTEHGFKIYSIGKDLIDDGGNMAAEKNAPGTPDTGFQWGK